jgi:hypothetical protein
MNAMSSLHNCENVVEIEDEPHHHLVIANAHVRAFAVEIPAHAHTLCHHHPNDYLLYIAEGAEIISAARDEDPKRLNYADGESELSKAGLVHVVENMSDHAFRNVVVELLPGARELLRSGHPAVISGEVRVERMLSEEPGAIFVIEMGPGAEAEIAGPAVLAVPYGLVMVKELEQFDIPLDDFRKLMWVCKPRKVEIRNEGPGTTKVAAVQIGRPQ